MEAIAQLIDKLGLPLAYLVVTLTALVVLWKHHNKVVKELTEEKKILEDSNRGLYERIITTTTEAQKLLSQVISHLGGD
jgi:hypothetical protein